MALLVLVFSCVLVLSFTVLGLAAKPAQHERAVEERVREIGLSTARPIHGENQRQNQGPKAQPLLKQAGRHGFRRMDEVLARFGFFSKLPLLIEQANSETTPGMVLLRTIGLCLAGFALTWLWAGLLPPALGVGSACALLPLVRLRVRRARRLKAFNAALPDALDLMSRALRAGHAVASAIEVVAEESQEPVAGEFSLVYQQQNFGLPFRDALLQMARRVPSNDLRFVVTAILVQKETGGNLTEILDRTTYVIRERLRIHGEVRVKTAQGRLTGWILSLLPVVMGVLINAVNPGYARPLFTDPVGHEMLYAAGGMLVVGGFVIRRIVNIEV